MAFHSLTIKMFNTFYNSSFPECFDKFKTNLTFFVNTSFHTEIIDKKNQTSIVSIVMIEFSLLFVYPVTWLIYCRYGAKQYPIIICLQLLTVTKIIDVVHRPHVF